MDQNGFAACPKSLPFTAGQSISLHKMNGHSGWQNLDDGGDLGCVCLHFGNVGGGKKIEISLLNNYLAASIEVNSQDKLGFRPL